VSTRVYLTREGIQIFTTTLNDFEPREGSIVSSFKARAENEGLRKKTASRTLSASWIGMVKEQSADSPRVTQEKRSPA
jgi:hypothetical protein